MSRLSQSSRASRRRAIVSFTLRQQEDQEQAWALFMKNLVGEARQYPDDERIVTQHEEN